MEDAFEIHFWQSQNLNEHRVIGDYLYFAHLNLEDYRKKLEGDLNRKIEELRTAEHISDEVTDEEIKITAAGIDIENMPIESKWLSVDRVSGDISFTYDFELLLYESFFFLWYGFVERRLKELLKILDLDKKRNVNRKQGFIYQFHEHLDKELNYKIDNSLWDELVLIGKLRNTLIHYGTDLPVDESIEIETLYSNYDAYVTIPSKLLEYINLKGIYETGSGEVFLNRDFCFYLIKFSEKLFQVIGYDLQKREQ